MDELFKEFLEETVVTVDKPSARLEVRNGPEDGRVFPIKTDTVRIGRQLGEPGSSQGGASVSNFIIRTDKAISREHCQLSALSNRAYLLKDMDSRFGTELNGTKIAGACPCKHGDTITIGDTMLMLRTED